jgi:hypothetical protein
MTIVDRAKRCITGWTVVWERGEGVLQQLLDGSPFAMTYYTDGFLLYQAGIYAGVHHALHNAVKLFVYAWNRRQLAKRRFPTYPAHLSSFVI